VCSFNDFLIFIALDLLLYALICCDSFVIVYHVAFAAVVVVVVVGSRTV